MEPIIRNYEEMESPESARLFLEESSNHFLLTHTYLADDFPAPLRCRVVKVGPNLKPGYLHVPGGAGLGFIRVLCGLAQEDGSVEEKPLSLAHFLPVFLAQLKDMVDLREVAANIVRKVSELFGAEGAAIFAYHEERNTLQFISTYNETADVNETLMQIEIPLGQGVAGWVAQHKLPLLVDRASTDHRFSREVDEKTAFVTRDLMAAPILLGDKLIGVLEVINGKKQPLCQGDIPTLSVLACVVAFFLEKAQLIAERKRHLRAMGKAEIANSVLHNIGNVLSSLLVSCNNIQSHWSNKRVEKLGKTSELLLQHNTDLAGFFAKDPRGEMVVPFLTELARQFAEERHDLQAEVAKIEDKTHLMRDIIETQQTIAKMGSSDAQDLLQIIEEALAVVADRLKQWEITVLRDFHSDKPIRGHRTKLVHIFINLLKNAVEAMTHLPTEQRILRLETSELQDGSLCISIEDNGYGIPAEVQKRLFSHGFTTKEDGHGFGLDFCAKAMEEMNGTIKALSSGAGEGATFTLTFPDFNKD